MNPAVKVVQPSGILDGTKSNQFRQQICASAEQAKIILIDFQDVTFMDSSGLGALVLSFKTVRSSGTQVFLCSLNEQIKMLFELTNVDRVFKIFLNREEFEQEILQ